MRGDAQAPEPLTVDAATFPNQKQKGVRISFRL